MEISDRTLREVAAWQEYDEQKRRAEALVQKVEDIRARLPVVIGATLAGVLRAVLDRAIKKSDIELIEFIHAQLGLRRF